MIAARDYNAREIALLTRHAVQRSDRAHHREIRNQLVVGVDQQLRPWTIDGHCLDSLSIAREPAVLDDAALFEQRHRFPVSDTIERNWQIQLVGADSEVGAGHCDSLRVSSQLEFRR